ncbi:hypothetical protein [Nocardioides luteus]
MRRPAWNQWRAVLKAVSGSGRPFGLESCRASGVWLMRASSY